MNEEVMLKAAVRSGDLATMENLVEQIPGFPMCRETQFPNLRWLEFVVIQGALPTVHWVVERYGDSIRNHNIDSRSIDYPLVFAALARGDEHKYDVLKLLLDAGADPNGRWLNDYTLGHQAAVENDCVALEILAAAGADFSLRTRVDDELTAREEALLLREGESDSTRFLELWEQENIG